MPNFLIRPKKYHDRLDAVHAFLVAAQERGRVVNLEGNPNGKLEMLAWCYDEIIRLREVSGEKQPRRKRITLASPMPPLA